MTSYHNSVLQEGIQFSQELLEKLIHFRDHGIEVGGVIVASEEFVDPVDLDPGISIVFQYTTQDGQVLTNNFRSAIHHPSHLMWREYAQVRQVGAQLRVIYDPEALFDPMISFSGETFSIDKAIAFQQAEIQRLQSRMKEEN